MRFPLPCSCMLLVLAFAAPVAANPTEELLRVAPPDAAVVLVVKNARDTVVRIQQSPFAEWFPGTPLGKHVLNSADVRKLRESLRTVCLHTEMTPESLLNDVLGDAIVFAFHSNMNGNEKHEHGILLVRPAKPEVLAALVDRVNRLQTSGGELAGVRELTHLKTPYFERKKSSGTSEFYCSLGANFAFSSTESEIQRFIERNAAKGQVSAHLEAMTTLGIHNAAAVLLVNPRAVDAEMQAKKTHGKPEEKAFLTWFGKYWDSLESAALFLNFGKDAEVGLALRVRDGSKALTGMDSLVAARLWSSIPDNAIVAIAGRQKISELVDSISALLPEEGRRAIRGAVVQTLAPVIGRDKLPLVIDSLGPDWGLWLSPPLGDGVLPVPVFALEVQAGEKQAQAEKSIAGALDYAFQTVRVFYNSNHADQLDLLDEKDGDVTIRSLIGEKTFPPRMRPSFAIKDGYLLLAGDSNAIRLFRKPVAAAEAQKEIPLFRFSGTSAQAYLQSHSEALSKLIAERSGTAVEESATGVRNLMAALEPLDRVDVMTRSTGRTIHFAARIKLVKPLEK